MNGRNYKRKWCCYMLNCLKIVVESTANNAKINKALALVMPKTLVVLLIFFSFIGFDIILTLMSIKTKNPKTKRFIAEVKEAELFFAIATLIYVGFAAATTIIGALAH